MKNLLLNLNSPCVNCAIVCWIQIIHDKIFEKKSMGTLSGALGGQVKFHSEKCCGSPYDLLVISGV